MYHSSKVSLRCDGSSEEVGLGEKTVSKLNNELLELDEAAGHRTYPETFGLKYEDEPTHLHYPPILFNNLPSIQLYFDNNDNYFSAIPNITTSPFIFPTYARFRTKSAEPSFEDQLYAP